MISAWFNNDFVWFQPAHNFVDDWPFYVRAAVLTERLNIVMLYVIIAQWLYLVNLKQTLPYLHSHLRAIVQRRRNGDMRVLTSHSPAAHRLRHRQVWLKISEQLQLPVREDSTYYQHERGDQRL